MELIRRLGRLRGLVDESRDLAARARLEAANHAHNDCVVGRTIFMAARGNVWHVDDQCPQLSRSQVLDKHACMHCSTYHVTPYRYNENTTTLWQDLNNYLGQIEDLSDEERFAADPIETIPDVQDVPMSSAD